VRLRSLELARDELRRRKALLVRVGRYALPLVDCEERARCLPVGAGNVGGEVAAREAQMGELLGERVGQLDDVGGADQALLALPDDLVALLGDEAAVARELLADLAEQELRAQPQLVGARADLRPELRQGPPA